MPLMAKQGLTLSEFELSVKNGLIAEGRIVKDDTLSEIDLSTENRLHRIQDWEKVLSKSSPTTPQSQISNAAKKLERFFPPRN
jgi:hypothetical protein